MPSAPRSILFPYTTLFRSQSPRAGGLPQDLMLALHDVHTYYGKSHVLHGVSIEVGPGEVVGLLGRNGVRSEEHTSELQSLTNLVCRLLLEKKNAPWSRRLG